MNDPLDRDAHAFETALKVALTGPKAMGSREQAEQLVIDLQIMRARQDSDMNEDQVALFQSIIERTEGPKAELLAEMLRHQGACRRILATIEKKG